ncbi:MAG: hypothetical protein WD491_11505 [Balneolales bacterium]
MIRSILFTKLILILAVAACDDTPGVVDISKRQPELSHLEITPSTIEFDREDGIKDTLVTFELSAQLDADEPLTTPPTVTFGERGSSDIFISEFLSDFDKDAFRYSGQVQVTFQTTTFGDYEFFVLAELPGGGISDPARAAIEVRGFATGMPSIEYTDHPDTVQIPSSGEKGILFEAKAIHPDGQGNIQNVTLELIDQDGRGLGQYNMLDDGANGDMTANDSLFTTGLEIGPRNQPDEYIIKIYAIDRFDAVSDTVTSHMSIVQ